MLGLHRVRVILVLLGEPMDTENVCHCEMSTAPAGHWHNKDGTILCLHEEYEDASDCPNAPEVMR